MGKFNKLLPAAMVAIIASSLTISALADSGLSSGIFEIKASQGANNNIFSSIAGMNGVRNGDDNQNDNDSDDGGNDNGGSIPTPAIPGSGDPTAWSPPTVEMRRPAGVNADTNMRLTFETNENCPLRTLNLSLRNASGAVVIRDASGNELSRSAQNASNPTINIQSQTMSHVVRIVDLEGTTSQITKSTCLKSIDYWNEELGLTTLEGAFSTDINNDNNPIFNGVPTYLPTTITSFRLAFNWLTYYNNPNIGQWNTSNVTNMEGVFTQASGMNVDLSGWDTSNVTNMSRMFIGASSFNRDLNSWNVRKVTNFNSMFQNARNFNNGEASGASSNALKWKAPESPTTSSMFSGAYAFAQPYEL